MRKTNLIIFILCACVLASQAYELREWEDVDGNRFTGRFIRELFGKLAVEAEDGSETTLEIQDLSDVDKKYIRVMIPPKIEAVTRTQSRKLKPRPADLTRDDIEKVHSVVAQIVKKSQRPFTSRLNTEIFLVGEEVEGDNYILLGRFEDSFLLLEEKDYQYELRSPQVPATQFTDLNSNGRKGELYKGHLLIITSMEGEVILMDSNLPKWMRDSDMIKNLRELSIRGAPSVRSRHFDKSGKKAPPPRPQSCPERTT